MNAPKPKKRIAFQTQANAFSKVVSRVRTGKELTVEKRLSYRDKSEASMSHAVRVAGDDAQFLRIEKEVLLSGRINYIFVFTATVFEYAEI